MGNLVSGNKTALLSAITTVQNDIAQLATDWTTLVNAQATARTLDDGTVYFGSQPNPTAAQGQSRLDDILSVSILAQMAACYAIAQGLRALLEGYTRQEASSNPIASGAKTPNAVATSLLSGH